MASVFINPRTDTGFKILFGKEGISEVFLQDFLNQLFKGDPELGNIESVKFHNVERTPLSIEEKSPRYDIFCQTSTGHRFIVEMQQQNQPHFMERTDYYVARAITDQAVYARSEGQWDYGFMPVVGVFITDFRINELPPKLVTQTREMDVDTKEVVGGRIRKAYVQLPYFDKKADECTTGFDKWIYLLKNMESLKEIPFKQMNDAVFARLAEVSRVATLSEEDRIRYDSDLKWARDYNATLTYARQEGEARGEARGVAIGEARGRKEGVAIGRKEGEARGRKEGEARGRKEGAIEIARNLKRAGLSLQLISDNTGLSVEEIERL